MNTDEEADESVETDQERGPLPRPRVLEGDHASIVRHQSFLSAALYGLVPLDAIDATL